MYACPLPSIPFGTSATAVPEKAGVSKSYLFFDEAGLPNGMVVGSSMVIALARDGNSKTVPFPAKSRFEN